MPNLSLTPNVQRLLGAILRGECSGPKFLEGGDYALGWCRLCGIDEAQYEDTYDLLWAMWTTKVSAGGTHRSY